MASKDNIKVTRRKFLKNSSMGILGASIIGKNLGSISDQINELPKIKAYRKLGRTGFNVSDIGSGAPVKDTILKALLRSGVNYIDTAESYFNGNNEALIGKSIKEFDRKSLFITTKIWPGRGFKSKEYIIDRVRRSLKRFDIDYIDCYMIHAAYSSELIKNEYFHSAIRQLKSEGRVRFCGVSCHGDAWKGKLKESMEKILITAIEDGRFDVLLLAYNFLQQDMGNRILKACREKNIGTTIMKANPVFDYSQWKTWITELEQGGKEISEWQRYILNGYKESAYKAEKIIKENNFKSDDEIFKDIAIPFVLSNPDVNSVLVAFTNFDYVKYHLNLSGETLTKSDKKKLINYKETFGQFYCRHACGICEQSCPNNIPVNTIMRYNHYYLTLNGNQSAMQENTDLPGLSAESCGNCEGPCETACPYKVPIKGLLSIAHKNLALG